MDTGKVLKRININHGIAKVTPSCPILIGDDMFYVFWLTGQYPDLVPLKLAGIPQLLAASFCAQKLLENYIEKLTRNTRFDDILLDCAELLDHIDVDHKDTFY
ncbi:unnamed protein product [Didymodactylos carnosus]|uniref:Uncharacterized protein n=1 Tax=Didymodactylos carnosus TaxID=1234261 RepID=A0A8S2G0P7_9BILA|nr:unnamed protein product [Didymodactylos carnosus]CAF4396751.1 unnamed protein product [Didymodactylos carnosus]